MKRETPNRLWYLVLFLAFLAEARLEHFDFCDKAGNTEVCK